MNSSIMRVHGSVTESMVIVRVCDIYEVSKCSATVLSIHIICYFLFTMFFFFSMFLLVLDLNSIRVLFPDLVLNLHFFWFSLFLLLLLFFLIIFYLILFVHVFVLALYSLSYPFCSCYCSCCSCSCSSCYCFFFYEPSSYTQLYDIPALHTCLPPPSRVHHR